MNRTEMALLIDDSHAVRAALGSVLDAVGFKVREAENGRDGLRQIQIKGLPELIVVDWNMPLMNGLDFIAHFRATWPDARCPVLLCTTDYDAQRVAYAREARADALLLKPFTPNVLRTTLESLASRATVGF